MTEASIGEAIAALARGDFVVVVDHEDRENEGDLILAAEKATAAKVAFMVRHTSGVLCLPIEGERLDELGLPLMVPENAGSRETAFTISVDAVDGTTTGISAADRATTIRAVADPATTAADLARPGHVFPLRAHTGGVLVRPGHTEAAVDLARLAGLTPAGVLAEVVHDDGTLKRGVDLDRFAAEHGIPLVTVEDLVTFRWRSEALVVREVETLLPTTHGEFRAVGFRSRVDGSEHIALVMGDVAGKEGVLTRVHSQCITGDVLGSERCDCGTQLDAAMGLIAKEGAGVVVYDRSHEGRGIGLLAKLRAYRLQDEGLDTVDANLELGYPADARHYGIDAQILSDLKVSSVRLLTNNPHKISELEALGVEVAERVPHVVGATRHNEAYLRTKIDRLGHLPPDPDPRE
jgi:3,4-dihydroxy 2-butanone 4-phosphate synthase / GTP cyclohydrolase II